MSAVVAELARLRGKRLETGKCPDHGITLVKAGAMLENNVSVGTQYKCPNVECAFTLDARAGSRMEKLLR